MSKSRMSQTACYAQGGPVLGKTSEFMKTPDSFRSEVTVPVTYGKGGGGQAKGKANPKPSNKQAPKP